MFKCAWFCKGRLIEALFDEYFWRVSFVLITDIISPCGKLDIILTFTSILSLGLSMLLRMRYILSSI